MPIGIRFTCTTNYEPGLARGEIVLDDFVEDFESSLSFWSASRDEEQWTQGIDRLLKGALRSCLITSISNPESDADVFGTWWTLYREGNDVVIHNEILLTEVLGNSFNPDDPCAHIPDRTSVNEDGAEISEWFVQFDSISAHLV